MLLTYIFYFIGLLSIIFIISDMSSWSFRINAAREMLSPESKIDLGNEWYSLKPIIQQHIIYAFLDKYVLFVYFLIGLMTSQWPIFLSLLLFKIIFVRLHGFIAKKFMKTFFSDICLPIFYKLIIISGLVLVIINRFHYQIF